MQLAALIWNGDEQLARQHLLRFTREGLLRRYPHPLYRNGPYVYTNAIERATVYSQKVLHHLQEVDFHVAVTRQLGRHGARIIPELPWGEGLIPDQTVLYRDAVWAIEHHLSGPFTHAADYQRFMEGEEYTACHWWRPEMRMGLLVITPQSSMDHVVQRLRPRSFEGLVWRVASRQNALRDPGGLLKHLPKPIQPMSMAPEEGKRATDSG